MLKNNALLNQEQKSAELYRIAYACEEIKSRGCNGTCAVCQFNVLMYDQSSEAVLIKQSAILDYHKVVTAANTKAWTNLMGLVLTIVIFLLVMWRCDAKKRVSVAPPPVVATTVAIAEPPRDNPLDELTTFKQGPLQERTKYSHSSDLHIQEVIDMCHSSIYDVNNDGLINCIDYAVRFKQIWGRQARLILNVNRATDMNHLFIGLPGGKWIKYIDPYGGAQYHNTMEEVWGDRYNPIYNKDDTDYWWQYGWRE